MPESLPLVVKTRVVIDAEIDRGNLEAVDFCTQVFERGIVTENDKRRSLLLYQRKRLLRHDRVSVERKPLRIHFKELDGEFRRQPVGQCFTISGVPSEFCVIAFHYKDGPVGRVSQKAADK